MKSQVEGKQSTKSPEAASGGIMTMESADMILNIALGLIALGVFFGIAFIVWNRPDTGERTPAQSASPDEGFFEDEPASPEGGSSGASGSHIRTALTVLAALILLVILGGRFWYMPAGVPPDVLQAAHNDKPASLQPMSVHESASPLHWRVEVKGRLDQESDGPPTYVFTYTVSRLSGDSQSSLSQVQTGNEVLLGLLVIISVSVLGYMAYTTIPKMLGRPCPECGSKPFLLQDETELISDREQQFTVSEGHYHCDTCGFNKIEVYEGSRVHHSAGTTTTTRPPGYSHLDGDHRQHQSDDEEELQANLQLFRDQRECDWFDSDDNI